MTSKLADKSLTILCIFLGSILVVFILYKFSEHKKLQINSKLSSFQQPKFFHQNLPLLDTFSFGSNRLETCRAITDDKIDQGTKQKLVNYLKNSTPIGSHNFSQSNCDVLKTSRGYITEPLSKEEEEYPIAYSIVIHKDLEIFERLFRAVYQPQNLYCVHVDDKADPEFKRKVSEYLNCFDNAIEPKIKEKVYYAHYSRLMADVHCLNSLNDFSNITGRDYKYVFNLCGQDFPIKTNFELVRSLKELNGRDECESFDLMRAGKGWRVRQGYSLNLDDKNYNKLQKDPAFDKPGVEFGPLGETTGLFGGSAYFSLSKASVDFILTDKKVEEFFNWSIHTYSPDEHVWATLSRYDRLPGSLPAHEKYQMNEIHTRTRLVKWAGLDSANPKKGKIHNVPVYDTCHGRWQRGVCIYGALDLEFLVKSRHWFANKFDLKVDSIAVDCLDFYLREKTIKQVEEQHRWYGHV